MRRRGGEARASASAFIAALLLNFAVPVSAQQSVTTYPSLATTANGDASGTVGTTNKFQLVFASTTGLLNPRHGCSVQNNGTHVMYVTEAVGIANSTLLIAWQVAASGGVYNCNFSGIVLTGEIDITGTAGDAFIAKQF